jgi:two-component system chemotaxis sensor kinase CheA
MPGMSGVEFTAHTRADEKLKGVPVIVVTSLASPAHKERALAAGASAYIVKSEFDQGRFIEKVALLAQGS